MRSGYTLAISRVYFDYPVFIYDVLVGNLLNLLESFWFLKSTVGLGQEQCHVLI